ncbi:hypothetical protein D3C76_789250 [compost metagenome]
MFEPEFAVLRRLADRVDLVFEGQPGLALVVIEPELIWHQAGRQDNVVGERRKVGVPQASLSVGHFDRLEFFDERGRFHRYRFHRGPATYVARSSQGADQCHVFGDVHHVAQGLLAVVVGPAFQAIENFEAKLQDGDAHHDCTQTGYEECADIERVER